jgi:hypothetical protein
VRMRNTYNAQYGYLLILAVTGVDGRDVVM